MSATGISSLRALLPVETAARELDAKLLLAAFLAREGGEAIVGSHARINNTLHRLPANCYVSQTIVRSKRRIFRIIRALGMHLAAWDEEGLVWPSVAYYRRRRLDPVNFHSLERFFAWGEEQAEIVREAFPGEAHKLIVTGNPRQDLYLPAMRPLYAAKVKTIRREFGEFILVNSNFGSVNHARLPYTGLEKSDADIRALADYSKHEPEYIAFRYRVFRGFCELIPQLAHAFPHKNIIIRPHPSENVAAWQEVARPFANVHVRYEYDLVPWLLAAEAIVHNGCTTAVEAAMLERPVIEFRPVTDEAWENPQPREVSIPAPTVKDVIGLLRRPEAMERERSQVERALRHVIAHWNEGFASERIARELMRLAREPVSGSSSMASFIARLKSRLRGMEKWVVGRTMPWKSASPAYIDKKFPPMPVKDVRMRLHRLAELAGVPKPEIEELDDRIWHVTPAGPGKGETGA